MRNLSKGNIYKTFILFAIPMVLSGLLSQTYNVIDTIIAGKYLGESGLGAIGATSPLITLVSSVFWGYGSGFSIYIANLYGSGHYPEIKNSIINTYLCVFCSVLIIAFTFILFHNPVFDFLKIDFKIRKDAFNYFSIYILGLFPIIFSHNGVYIMNSFGVSTFPFVMSIISALVNITGNIFTVTVLNWGVSGIALSTVFASFCTMICYFFKLKYCFAEMNISQRFIFGLKGAKKSMAYAVPVTLQQMIMYISQALVSPLVNGIGSAASASYAVVTRIYDINASIYQNSAKTLSNFTAQCMGAKNYRRIRKGVKVALIQGVLFVLPSLLISVFCADSVCRIFFPDGYNGDGLIFAVNFTRFFLPFILFNLINNLFHAFFRGVKAMKFLIFATLTGAVTRIVLSYFLVNLFTLKGFWSAWVISWIAEAIVISLMYFSHKWRPEEMIEYENSNRK